MKLTVQVRVMTLWQLSPDAVSDSVMLKVELGHSSTAVATPASPMLVVSKSTAQCNATFPGMLKAGGVLSSMVIVWTVEASLLQVSVACNVQQDKGWHHNPVTVCCVQNALTVQVRAITVLQVPSPEI